MTDKMMRVPSDGAKGFRDLRGPELELRSELTRKIMKTYAGYGFEALETPAVEPTEALGGFLPDTDRPNGGAFSFETDETDLTLRYDLTAPLARFVAGQGDDLTKPWRRSSAGPVWRNEKSSPGRYREFWQCDADLVGAPSIGADAEMIAMASEALKDASVGDFTIKLSNRKLLDGLLAGLGIRDEELQRNICRSIDKLDRLGADGVADLLGAGRRDASGAFIAGLELTDTQIKSVVDFTTARDIDALASAVGSTELGADGLAQIDECLMLARAADAPVLLDPSIVRGLSYYSGTVFEIDLLGETFDESGAPRRIGSIGGGGRYDSLIRRFTGRDLPCVGFSIGVTRLAQALSLRGAETSGPQRPILICVLDEDGMARAQEMARELRAQGMPAQVWYGASRNIGRQMKYADKIEASLAVIEGARERNAGEVVIKYLDLGREISERAADREAWLSQEQQVTVNREDLGIEIDAFLAM
jgi:histidyl-tRNA synthetase